MARPIRVLTETVDVPQRGTFTVQVVQDRTTEQRTLGVIQVVLLVGGLLVLVVSFGFGTVYARRAMVPIRESLTNQRTALRRQREFAADASHELRTPLTVIRSSVEHLARHRDETVGSVGSALEDIDDEVRHMTSIVEDLLLLARSDSGAVALEHVPVDLGDVAADGASAMGKPATDRGVRVEVDPQPAVVAGDPARLRQLVMILVDNAIRHSPTDGRVGVAVRAVGSGASLVVEDDGPGIRPEDLPHVFERFYRAPGAPGGGTGLGLAIAAWIVDRHGGRIEVANRAEGGARFVVDLPAAGRRARLTGRSALADQVAIHPVGPHRPLVVGDRERRVVRPLGEPAQAVETHDVDGGRIRVGEGEPGPDDGHAAQARRRQAGPRVRDVRAAFVRAGRRDGPVGDLEHGRDAIGLVGMPDPDPPRPAALGIAARDDVAAGVDPVVAATGGVEPPGRLLDRPALDVAGRIEDDRSVGAAPLGGERATGDLGQVVAGGQDVTDVEAAVLLASSPRASRLISQSGR